MARRKHRKKVYEDNEIAVADAEQTPALKKVSLHRYYATVNEDEVAIPTVEEAIAETTMPPNPDQPPPTTVGEVIDTGVTYDEAGRPLNTAPLEPTNEEKDKLNNSAMPPIVGAPEEEPEPYPNIHERVRNVSHETVVSGPGGVDPIDPDGGPPPTEAPTVVDAPLIWQEGETLVCTMGNWNGEPTSRTYQWQRDGEDVGIGTETYMLVTDDTGKAFTCTMTATNAIGTSEPVTSNEVIAEAVT